MTNQRSHKLKRQLQEARYRLFKADPAFADPLYDMTFVATDKVRRISTNGAYLYFDPNWLQKLNELELDYMLSHQLMHIKLKHIDRPSYYRGDRYHLACDIIANSRLRSQGWNYEKIPHIGKIYFETFFPCTEGRTLTPEQAFLQVPFDPATLPDGSRRQYIIDSDAWWERKTAKGEAGTVVLSPADLDPPYLSVARYSKDSGLRFCAKEEYEPKPIIVFEPLQEGHERGRDNRSAKESNHDMAMRKTINILRGAKRGEKNSGTEGPSSTRYWEKVNDPSLDWRTLLNLFIQEDVCDYSFTPPDRRYYEAEFFMPDYNVTSVTTKAILFMVDTSGSVTDETLNRVYAELHGAIEQFPGLQGMIGFFDAHVHRPVPFDSVNSLSQIVPRGGGGTSFYALFREIRAWFSEILPSCIVVITDGIGTFPDEKAANGIPVLWLLTDKEICAPWGKNAWI